MTSINIVAKLQIAAFAVLFCTQSVFGQWTDYGTWSGISLSQKLSNQLEVSSEAQARLDYDASRLGSAFANLSVSRKISPFWKLSSAFRLGASRAEDFSLETLSRIAVSAKYKHPITSNISMSLRFQYQIKPDIKQTFRLSPALYYKVSKKMRIAISSEIFAKPSLEGFYHSGSRFRILAKHKVSKRRWISMGYQIEREKHTPDPWTQHVFICSYDLELKQRNGKK
tara:strand:- start:3810 stop:4487 length:678 start_codon:yes stop_codon:yes gene_type:complete